MRVRVALQILALLGMAGMIPISTATSGAKPVSGAVVETAKAVAFACQGRVVKSVVKADPGKKSEETKPIEDEVRKTGSYLAWSCRSQSAAQKALNGLYIPAPDGGPTALDDALRQSAKINQAVGQALGKKCSCSFDPHNAKTKKPMVACTCSGSYKEPKSGER